MIVIAVFFAKKCDREMRLHWFNYIVITLNYVKC